MTTINYQTTNSSLQLKSMDEQGYFSGYASVFNNVDQQNDLIMPGAFESCISVPKNIKLLWQHMSEEPIGVIEELREDRYGLYIKARLLLDLAKGREVYTLLTNGAVNGLSIGYKIKGLD
jgi:HK97 family phage prohead protease